MKKWILVFAVLLIIVLAAFFILRPSGTPGSSFGVKTSSDAAYRTLSEQKKWDSLAGADFKISKRLLNMLEISVISSDDTVPLMMYFIPVMKDSVFITWQLKLPEHVSLMDRITKNSLNSATQKKVQAALPNIKNHLEKKENIYGIPITQTSTKDTFLIAKKFTTPQYPSTQEIYEQISKLEAFAADVKANPAGFPMLNVTQFDTAEFRCMVALPINKIVDDKKEIFFVRMVPGQFMTTEVIGGPHTIANAHKQVGLYFKEFQRTSMAIPFEYLVTNRLHEPDTTKWITRIYAPVY